MKGFRLIPVKRIGKILLSLVLILSVLATSMLVASADDFHTIRINYYFVDGTRAHDPYIATYTSGYNIADLVVKNPSVNGFVPMTLNDPGPGEDPYTPEQLVDHPEIGTECPSITFNVPALNENVERTVYYVPGMTHYAARYYLQNIYDDLYELDRDRTEANKNRLGKTGSAPTNLESEEITGFTSLFHEPDVIAADGSTVFRVYYDRNYYTINFDLGEGGYGVEPIYAKYQMPFRLEEPKRAGYTFLGWARTNADSSKGDYGTDWFYIDPDAVLNITREDDGNGNKVQVTHYYRNATAFENKEECALDDVKISEDIATNPSNLVHFSSENDPNQTIPAYNSYYKALWQKGDAKFSIAYWVEEVDSELADNYFEQLDVSSMTSAQLRAIVLPNYANVALFEATRIKDDENSPARNVQAGDHIGYNTLISNVEGEWFPLSNFFEFNFEKQDVVNNIPQTDGEGNPVDSNDKKIDFPNMSIAQRADFAPDLQRYYDPNLPVSLFQFGNSVDGYVEIAGDGSTIINIFFKRKTFNLQFFYAKTKGGTVTYDENGVPSWSKGSDSSAQVLLTNGTKQFSKNTGKTTLYGRLDDNLFNKDVIDTLPQIVNHTDMITPKIFDNGGTTRFWYYEIKAKFGASLLDKWFNDAFDFPLRKDAGTDTTQKVFFGSWAVEKESDYIDREDDRTDRGNYTIKGLFERLYDEILLKDSKIRSVPIANPTELHFVASWDNTDSINGTAWNSGRKRVYNFTYKNVVELLPSEDYIATTPNGYSVLINGGTYPAGDHEELNESGDTVTVHYQSRKIEGRYTDIVEMDIGGGVIKRFGLTADHTVETYDAGGDYGGVNYINNANTVGKAVRKNQTAASLTGFKIYGNDDGNNSNDIKTTFTVKRIVNGELVTETINTCYNRGSDSAADSNYGNGNMQGIFYAANDFDKYHHADIYFFYSRNDYRLKYSNQGSIDQDNIFRAYYHAPLFLQKFQITPEYPIVEQRDYYNFDGWYYDPFYIKPVDFANDRILDDDVILYAKWVPKTINVVFYNNYDDYYIDRKDTAPLKKIVLNQHDIDVARDAGVAESNLPAPLTVISVDYGSYIPLLRIPIDDASEGNIRPRLSPMAEGASFAGWYYIRNRVPMRFEPENVPVTALNAESSGGNATLRLFAEWVTKDVAKYEIKYIKKKKAESDPDEEIAPSTVGRAYVWKTKTFFAKTGDELYDEYKWTAAGETAGTNWWPTNNSHSMVIKSNTSGYAPNEYSFEYIQKDKVHYRVRYLDANTRVPLRSDVIRESTHAAVTEDALVIPGYVVEQASMSQVLVASSDGTSDEQCAWEIENNVINFLYRVNDKDYLYEVEYRVKDIEGSTYSTYATETLLVPIVEDGDTVVHMADLFSRPMPTYLSDNGFEPRHGTAEYIVTNLQGVTDTEHPVPVADDGSVVITDQDKKCIVLYYDRKQYPYTYQYIDHTAEKAYIEYLEAHPGDTENAPWDGVIDTIDVTDDPSHMGYTGQVITIVPDTDLSGVVDQNLSAPNNVFNYTRITSENGTLSDVTLTIQPDDGDNGLNVVKIYYRKDIERELNYQMVCVNNSDDTDYESDTPMFGRLSITMQTVLDYDGISSVTFYSTNDEKVDRNGVSEYMHLHRYTFLGWYSTPEYDPAHPEVGRLTTNTVLSKENLGTNGELPARDVKYYALVKQDMVKLDIMFYFLDNYSVDGFKALDDDIAIPIIQSAIDNADNPTTDNKIYPTGERGGVNVVFSSPEGYQNHAEIPWHRNDGYSLSMSSIDARVYKYEFCMWYEYKLDETSGVMVLIPHDNWNNSLGWDPDQLTQQVPRNTDNYFIAVYARKPITQLPYTINYTYRTRTQGDKTFVKTGVLTEDDLKGASAKVNESGCFELTDEFILSNAPYESNHGERLEWTDAAENVEKTSVGGSTTTLDDDRIITNVTAVQTPQTVVAHYRTTPVAEYNEVTGAIGDNYKLNEGMTAIVAQDTYGDLPFSHWEVRKSSSESGPVIAKSYEQLFDLCLFDNYWITPVYRAPEESTSGPAVILTHLDYSRNRWTDEAGAVNYDGSTDLLYTDFEIAFEDGRNRIHLSDEYQVGVVFEQCEAVLAGDFVPDYDYAYLSDPGKLKNAIKNAIKKNVTSGRYSYDPDNLTLKRAIQLSYYDSANLTNHDRVNYAKSFRNGYTINASGEYEYTNKDCLIKVTAFLIKDNEVTLSNSMYICLKDIASKNSVVSNLDTSCDPVA